MPYLINTRCAGDSFGVGPGPARQTCAREEMGAEMNILNIEFAGP